MTEQINSAPAAVSMVQIGALQTDPAKVQAKAPAKDSGESSFQKLLTRKAAQPSAKSDGQPREQAKVEKDGEQVEEKQEGPVQEDAQTTAQRLAQMGLIPADTGIPYVVQEVLPETDETQEAPLQAVSLEELPEGGLVTAEFDQDGPVETVQGPMRDEVRQEVQPQREVQAQEDIQPREEVRPQAREEVQPRQAAETARPSQTERTEAPAEQAAPVHAEKAEARDSEEPEVEIAEVEQAPQPVFQHVEAAPVKVGEAYRAEDSRQADQPDVANQIDTQLSQAMERGESYVRIQLNPESLGSVTVEVSRSADGALRIALTAHSGETRSLLERHSNDLQGLLSSRTQQTVQVEVQRQQESQQGRDQHPYDGRNGHAQEQGGGQQRQRRQDQERGSQDFIQQLRLGLIPMEDGED